ncbi:hypothetical protein [Pedobacter endophyticus]|uniref:Uncharacterized protein n=1 Tax=Pedobacter endophyticus TaxID=2789740 RepID=A0A7U3SNZ7_9SPHI|nr:hypothetical protein [Pedobacter endophyticus]QPH37898.1 hypothetical protein IZT61_12345 [Pedobacter endophyticus]
MLKEFLSICVLLACSYGVHSQVLYVPNPLPSNNGYLNQQQQSDQEAQVLTAYSINPTTQSVLKYRIKVVTYNKVTKIISYKPLSSEYWSNLALPITATRISMYDPLAEQFEYKVYLTPLLANIYF